MRERPSVAITVLSVLLAGVSIPAAGQTTAVSAAPAASTANLTQVFVTSSYPGVESTLAWSVVRDTTLSDVNDVLADMGLPSVANTSTAGFNVAVTANSNPWFGVTVEGGANFLKQDFNGLGTAYELQEWTALTGPKFTVRNVRVIQPYAQFLVGAAYLSLEVPIVGFSDTDWDFVLQPGAGVDIVLTDTVAVRLGFDGRLLSDKAFSGQTYSQFRFTLGATFRSSLR